VARALLDVRRATSDDLDEVLALWAQGRDEVSRHGRPSTPAEQVAPRLAEALAAGEIDVLLARREGRPAGFLIYREMPLTFLADQQSISIDQMFVAPGERRHGVARAMLGQVAARAERIRADQIVSSVAPAAREMHRFFARLGFAPVTVRRSVAPAALRRRLGGEKRRGALEDLLSRRRSLRARAGRAPVRAIIRPDGQVDGPADLSRLA
jgi:GNAT superfamily N-acetyltransferase